MLSSGSWRTCSVKMALILGVFFQVISAFAGEPSSVSAIPQEYPLGRYRQILDKSAFVRETAAEVAPAAPNFAQDYIMTGHFRLGETIFVNVLNKKTQERMTLSSAEQDSSRPRVISLTSDEDPYGVKAVIQLGLQTGTINFDRPAPPKLSLQAQQQSSATNQPAPTGISTTASSAPTPQPSPVARHPIRPRGQSSGQ